MVALDYCGTTVFVNKPIGKTFLYARVGTLLGNILNGVPIRYSFVYDDGMFSRFPNLTQEDLFECICSIKRKYQLS